MRLNNKNHTVDIKCRPILWSITEAGGKHYRQPIDLLPEVQDLYNLWSVN